MSKETEVPKHHRTFPMSTTTLATITLALLFMGVWICDAATLSIAPLPDGYLTIRVFSLVYYLITFVFAWGVSRKYRGAILEDPKGKRLLSCLVIVGCVLAAVGFLGLATNAAQENQGINSIFVFLTKSIGPCLSIPLLLLFGCLERAHASKVAGVGMVLAFAAEKVFMGAVREMALPSEGVLGVGVACLVLASAAVMLFIQRNPGMSAFNPAEHDAFVYSRKGMMRLVAYVVTAALMLGFLRSQAVEASSADIVAAIAVLVAVAASAVALPRLSPTVLCRSAIICAVAGMLLSPLLSLVSETLPSVLFIMSCPLFEALIWVLSVEVMRAARQPFCASAAIRLVAVTGHLLGSVISIGATTIALNQLHSGEAASMVLTFIYVLALLGLSHGAPDEVVFAFADDNDARRVPLKMHEQAQQKLSASSAGDSLNREASVSAADSDASLEDYWRVPCKVLAARAQLTPRELEVLEQLAQGRDLSYMEDKFVLSRNTIKMHVRNVYAKLGVHGKQEVIDLVDATRRSLERKKS